MSRPRTDKERVLVLEAKVAELQAELSAWRANDREEMAEADRAQRVAAVVLRLKERFGRNRGYGAGPVRVLLELLDNPGRLRTRRQLIIASRPQRDVDEVEPAMADVYVVALRRLLRGYGFPDAIATVRAVGWRLDRAQAPAICAALEPADA